MKLFIRVLSVLWKVYFILVLVSILILLYPIYFILLNDEKFFGLGFKVMRFQARIVLFLVGIWPRIEQLEATLPNGPFIICPNHTSYLDILLLYRLFPKYFIFMGKQELGQVPVFNIFFKKMNILVDRKSVTGSVRALGESGKAVDKGHRVVIFPEGTIPHNAPEMRNFKNGPFKLAISKALPIVPVTFVNNYVFLQDGAFFKRNGRPGRPKVVIHPAVKTTGMTEADLVSLRNTVHDIIKEPLSNNEGKR
jgi:1-acyl-sn-glycerol-3-phosphate acyltransferase